MALNKKIDIINEKLGQLIANTRANKINSPYYRELWMKKRENDT